MHLQCEGFMLYKIAKIFWDYFPKQNELQKEKYQTFFDSSLIP